MIRRKGIANQTTRTSWIKKMASHTKTSGLPSAVDTVDLERAIHNLEFEKKQQIREIEKEKQQISFVEASLKEKQDDIQRIEANLTRLDEETKSFHKQFRQNKEQTESQKKHSAVLNIHITNKEKDVQQLMEKCEAELTTFHKKLEHYDQLWKSYEDIYMQQENAQELMKWQLEVLQCKEAIKEGGIQISRLREEEESLKKDIIASQPPFPSVTDFIIRIAEIKHSTTCNIKEIEDSLSTLFLVEKEVQILKEDQAKFIKKLEEKKRQEDEEREKNEKEKALQEELARKTRDEQHNATNPKQAGIYKLGQFTHRAATQPPAARVPPNTTKRSSAPTSRPPPSPRTPLLIPIPARSTTQSVPPPLGVVALSPNHQGGSQVGNRGGAPPLRIEDRGALPQQQPRPPVTRPSQQGRILLNMPAQHRPVRQEWGAGRMQAPLMQLGARVNMPQQAAASDMETNMDTTSRTALSNTMYNMSLAPAPPGQLSPVPIKPASQITPGPHVGAGQSGVQQLSPRNQTKQEPAVAQRKEPMVGPGGDAQPFPVKCPQQQPGSDEPESFTLSQPGSASDIGDGITMDIDEYPLTPGTDAGMETDALTKTPQTPGDQFLLGGRIRDEQATKSPGFVYTSRAMFAGEGPQERTQSSDNSCSGTDMFFNTFFGMGGSRSDPPVSTSMANMFGGGGNTPPQTAPSTATKQGGAMAMFGGGAEVGDSPSLAPVMDLSESSHQQDQDQGASMGFSFNFGGSSPSPDEQGTGGGKSGFCLF